MQKNTDQIQKSAARKCTIHVFAHCIFMLLVGPCSSTKRHPVAPTLDGTNIRARSVRAFARTWLGRLEKASAIAPATDMYGGGAHRILLDAGAAASARLLFVSAGLGVVSARERIPAYNLTVSPTGPGPFAASDVPFEPARWWAALHQLAPAPLARRVRRHDGVTVLALPASYLAMVGEDLCSLGPAQRSKLRIITTPGVRLPEDLKQQAVRYDGRLNSVGDKHAGGVGTLVQRAALHYVTRVLSDGRLKDINAERCKVQSVLDAQEWKLRVARERVTDPQVRALIRKAVKNGARSVTAALQALRTEHGVACEQARFATIYEEVIRGRA